MFLSHNYATEILSVQCDVSFGYGFAVCSINKHVEISTYRQVVSFVCSAPIVVVVYFVVNFFTPTVVDVYFVVWVVF